jgi:hypothetical protein
MELVSDYTLKNAVVWDVTPCVSCKNRCFGGTLVLTRATGHNIPEDGILHSHHSENLKSYKVHIRNKNKLHGP